MDGAVAFGKSYESKNFIIGLNVFKVLVMKHFEATRWVGVVLAQ